MSARSRFTGEWTDNSPREVLRRVSGAKPTEKLEAVTSNRVTVRHVPFTEMLSPRFTPSRTLPAEMVISNPSPAGPTCSTLPTSSTIPVKRDRIGGVAVKGGERLVLGLKRWETEGVDRRWRRLTARNLGAWVLKRRGRTPPRIPPRI